MFSKLKQVVKNAIFYKKNTKERIAILETEVSDLTERLDWFIEHSDITTLKPAVGYLRRKQLALLEFVDGFFSEIASLGIHPFLIGGNLIGAYRHKGYIPWDDDLDFGLIRNEYDTLIEYCKNNYHVEIYDGKWSEYTTDKHIARMDSLVKKYPDEYILDIWVDQLQIMRGTSCIDRLAVDFWSYDYYKDDYDIYDHINYLRYLSDKKKLIDYVDEIVVFLRAEIDKNPNISKTSTSIVFPGIDNVEGYLRMDRTDGWLRANDLFPLKHSEYEGRKYYVPGNAEKWMSYEYPDYMSYPSDAGCVPHEGYKEKYILHHMPTVEFYLVDAFEIYHFMPLYYFFERHGVYSRFVAENPGDDTAWFDYKEAIKILETNGVRYTKKPDYLVSYVFTTQDESVIVNYKGRKIHLCYGVGLTTYSFCESDRTIKGFDLKIVHGDISYNSIEKKLGSTQIIISGYLRYSKWNRSEYIYDNNDIKEQIRMKNINNKPILLYFPTWDTASSIDLYAEQFAKLRERFFIITKAHHCTSRLDSETKHREILHSISDIVLAGNYSFEDASKLGNIAVCDAISGSATEVPYVNRGISLILLFSPIEDKNKYKSFIDDFSRIVSNPDDLNGAIDEILIDDKYLENRQKILDKLYSPREEQALEEIKEYIIENYKERS